MRALAVAIEDRVTLGKILTVVGKKGTKRKQDADTHIQDGFVGRGHGFDLAK